MSCNSLYEHFHLTALLTSRRRVLNYTTGPSRILIQNLTIQGSERLFALSFVLVLRAGYENFSDHLQSIISTTSSNHFS